MGSSEWAPARLGLPLNEGDEIRTGSFSETTLALPRRSSVVIGPKTSFVVGQDRVQRSTFELGEGSIVAAIPKQTDHSYWFHSRGSEAVATAEQGEFSLQTDGRGTVVIDTHKGEVKVKAEGREVKVAKGARSVVLPKQPPTEPLPVPTSLALQVRWPPAKTDQPKTRISGKTEAAAQVLVNGVSVRADQRGEFQVDVPLREGSNQVVVTATDAAGNSTSQQSPEIRVDTRPPDVKVDAEGLWR